MNGIENAIAHRKFAKTCVEKKRRDRINKCLEELKELMSVSEDKARYQKLEKAEILEMAVTHMRNLRNRAQSHTNTDQQQQQQQQQVKNYYNLAVAQCLKEFHSFLSTCTDVQEETKRDAMSYLTKKYSNLIQNNHRYSPYQTNTTHTQAINESQQNYHHIKLEGYHTTTTASTTQESENKYVYQKLKYAGSSCSSLDSYQMRASSPSDDSNSQSSVCSSPIIAKDSSCSSLNFSNIDIDSKVWRPW